MLVALLAEGVDRNDTGKATLENICVALLAEGVDRNPQIRTMPVILWVALLAEGVDRNMLSTMQPFFSACRPPRGGRG